MLTRNSTCLRVALAIAAVSAFASLAGCGISKDLRLDIQGSGLAANSAVSLQAIDAENQPASRFAAAVADALAQSGHTLNDAATVTAVISFAQRDRAIGEAGIIPAADGSESKIDWLSKPTRKHAFQACTGERVRATLALYSRAEQALIYRGTGEFDACEVSQADLAALAEALVMGASKGADPTR